MSQNRGSSQNGDSHVTRTTSGTGSPHRDYAIGTGPPGVGGLRRGAHDAPLEVGRHTLKVVMHLEVSRT